MVFVGEGIALSGVWARNVGVIIEAPIVGPRIVGFVFESLPALTNSPRPCGFCEK